MDSTPDLELSVSQALFAARMLELAVHHQGPWTFKWGDIEVPATREVTESGVTFTGRFPDLCYLRHPEGGLLILCQGTVMGMRSVGEIEHPGDTGFEVSWSVLVKHDRVDR